MGKSYRQYRTHFLTFLKVQEHPPTFSSAADLRGRIEMLPEVPRWSYQEIILENHRTKEPMVLYYRNGLDVIAQLFSNPVFAHHLEMTPYKLSDESNKRVYGEFMSADFAWNYQVSHHRI